MYMHISFESAIVYPDQRVGEYMIVFTHIEQSHEKKGCMDKKKGKIQYRVVRTSLLLLIIQRVISLPILVVGSVPAYLRTRTSSKFV
jgi:hypothetical protein